MWEVDNILKYTVRDGEGRMLISQELNDISVVQNWGLFLDKQGNLGVFSSDIVHSIWENDSQGSHRYREFDRELTKDDVPEELYESSLKRFLE